MTALILNDTDDGGAHFGCTRVMRTIRAELAARGLVQLPSIKVGTDWRADRDLTAQIDAAKLVVINGEGTLHHGKRRGRWLLEAGARVKARGGRVALINALWQDNPDDWGQLAREFDILACRDSRSAAELARQTGRDDVIWLGDLSMLHPGQAAVQLRHGITVSCSVSDKVTTRLARLSHALGADFVPVTTRMKSVPDRLSGLKRAVKTLRTGLHNRLFLTRFPETRFLEDDLAYLTHLARHDLLVTGRFHAVCLSILSRTPFLATASNSWKIETLISDIGLDPARALPLEQITADMVQSRDWNFVAAELQAIDESLARWRAQGALLFDRIAALTPDPPTSAACCG